MLLFLSFRRFWVEEKRTVKSRIFCYNIISRKFLCWVRWRINNFIHLYTPRFFLNCSERMPPSSSIRFSDSVRSDFIFCHAEGEQKDWRNIMLFDGSSKWKEVRQSMKNGKEGWWKRFCGFQKFKKKGSAAVFRQRLTQL